MKGANRKLFRKPGLARQAIGILASSKELADQVQSVAPNMMPRQPVQKFRYGGLASLLGITPAGYEMVNEELVARPGFSGMYERMSGISDPARAREQSGIDLMKLGARIAGGQSGSTTTNVAQALTTTLDEIGKNRQTEYAMTLKEAEMARALEDAKLTRDLKERTLAVSTFGATMTDDKLDALSAVGITPSIDGSALYDGKKYNSINDAVDALPAGDQAAYKANIALGSRDSAGERIQTDVLDSAGDVRTRLAQLSGMITSSDINIRDSIASNHLESMSQFRTTQGGATPKSRFSVKKGNNDEQALRRIFGDNINLSDNRNYYVLEDANTQEYVLVDESGTLIDTDKRLLETLKQPTPDETPKETPEETPKETPQETPQETPKGTNTTGLPQDLSEMVASLKVTDAEQTAVQNDRMLIRLKKELERSKANLEDALAGTKKLDPNAIQQVIERQQRQIDARLRKLYAEIPRQRQLSLLKGNRRGKASPSTDSTTIAQDSSTTGS